jgi:hypothetical protein
MMKAKKKLIRLYSDKKGLKLLQQKDQEKSQKLNLQNLHKFQLEI